MKFKVGDKVRVVNTHDDCKRDYIGKTFYIKSVNPNGKNHWVTPHYGLGLVYTFKESELELAEFTKSDLKDGMVVEYRDGGRRLVLKNKFIGMNGCLLIDQFKDTLEHRNNDIFTIDKVYKSNSPNLDGYFKDHNLTLAWERHLVKKMTIEEIEKELGYKIEIVNNQIKLS